MSENNLILINFSRKGGIYSFASNLNNQLKPFLFINTNNIFLLLYYLFKHKTNKLIFCNNNYKIYLFRMFINKPILIMHDHNLRNCPKILERVTLYLFILKQYWGLYWNDPYLGNILFHNLLQIACIFPNHNLQIDQLLSFY